MRSFLVIHKGIENLLGNNLPQSYYTFFWIPSVVSSYISLALVMECYFGHHMLSWGCYKTLSPLIITLLKSVGKLKHPWSSVLCFCWRKLSSFYPGTTKRALLLLLALSLHIMLWHTSLWVNIGLAFCSRVQ